VLESIGALAETPIAEAEAKAVLDSQQQAEEHVQALAVHARQLEIAMAEAEEAKAGAMGSKAEAKEAREARERAEAEIKRLWIGLGLVWTMWIGLGLVWTMLVTTSKTQGPSSVTTTTSSAAHSPKEVRAWVDEYQTQAQAQA
jgi:hypothetical protein